MLNLLRRILGSEDRPSRAIRLVVPRLHTAVSRLQSVRARYDAAVTSDDNRRHWAHADGLSANAANSAMVRRTLRNRARYETANNSYARGIVLTLANDVVGTGPRLQLTTSDAAANFRIERAFMSWAKAVRLAEKLRTMRMARATDGEAFAILTSNPRLPTEIQLDVRLIEADQVTTPHLLPLSPTAVDGIVFDAFGNPQEYHVLRRQTELAVLRGRRPTAPAVHVPDNHVTSEVLEAACFLSAGLANLEQSYQPQKIDRAALPRWHRAAGIALGSGLGERLHRPQLP
ncbi:MAG: hypothetical protein RLY70_741 [Planctomycetota bacterium]